MPRFLRWAVVLLPMVMAGCSSLFGSPEAPPLPGERISILSLQQVLEPDPGIADLEVRLPRPWVNTAWPQSGGYPSHAMHHLALSENPRIAWRIDVGSGSGRYTRLLATPIIADGMVFTLDADGRILAVTEQNGRSIWRFDVTPEDEARGALGGGIAYQNGVVFAATGFGEVIAVDARSGSEKWRVPLKVPFGTAPTIDDGRVFVITLDNQFIALDADDGAVLWTYVGIAEPAGLIGAGSPAAADGVVVAPFSSGEIIAFWVENGNIAWTDSLIRAGRVTALTELNDINSRPVIDRGMVFAISHAGRMVAVDVRSGARIWTLTIGGIQSPWVAGDFVFVITLEAEIVALSRRDGRVRWVTPLARFKKPGKREGPITWRGPVLAGDRLIAVSSEGEAIAISPYSGRIIGRIKLRGDATIAPVVANGTLFVLTDNGALSALR